MLPRCGGCLLLRLLLAALADLVGAHFQPAAALLAAKEAVAGSGLQEEAAAAAACCARPGLGGSSGCLRPSVGELGSWIGISRISESYSGDSV